MTEFDFVVTFLALFGLIGMAAAGVYSCISAGDEPIDYSSRFQRIWVKRLAGKTIVAVEFDGRRDLFGRLYSPDRTRILRHFIGSEIGPWLSEMVGAEDVEWGIIPDGVKDCGTGERGALWFADPNDALAFKIRWY